LSRLPQQLSGFRIAQLSDVHIGDILGQRFLRGVVEQTNRTKPDLIAITGDLVDGSVEELGPAVAELAKLKARHGVYFVTGNHEYYSGAESWIAFLRSLGIVVLENQRVSIGADGAGSRIGFDLIGVPDHRAWPVAPDMQAAALHRDVERELVVLAHQPVQVKDAIAINAGLQLSGHTHGGQMVPFNLLTSLVQPHIAGLDHAGGNTQIYTSRGTGFWGPPMRVLAPAEITSLVLTS
jgi:predicted MPP superfamily phosphohydrolase